MPKEDWHKEKSNHNKEAYLYLKKETGKYLDWEAVTLFYAAIQLIEMLLARQNIHPENHDDRYQCIKKYFKEIRQPYISIYETARRARYAADIIEIERDNALSNFYLIKKYVDQKFANEV